MELYEEFYRRPIINLRMELSVFYVCSNFGHSFRPRIRTGTGPTQKATNWIFLSKVAILKAPLVCHCRMQKATRLQCSTPSPLKFPKNLESSETASKKQMWSWSGAQIQALSPPSMWNQEGFGTEQLFWACDKICSWPSYLQLSQVPLGHPPLSFPLYARREAETFLLHCCLFKFWLCERGYEGSNFTPQDSVGSRTQQRMCQEPSDPSKLEKLGTWLISHSKCLVWVAPCRNPAMILVPGSPLQPLKTSSKHSSSSARGHTQTLGETSRNQEFQPSWLETFKLPAKTSM